MTPATGKETWESPCVSTSFSCNALSDIEYEKVVLGDLLYLGRRIGDKYLDTML
jgi:hypothetical protein